MRHDGINIRWNGRDHRIDLRRLTGKSITVYSQHLIVQDLIAARLAAGGHILFEAANVAVHDFHTDRPRISFTHDGAARRLDCEFIAGCDGFHGVCRDAIPARERTAFEKDYPFGWLGILADAAPASHEVTYARHDNGFALLSMRSPSVSRLYLQCAPDEDIDQWSDDRIWAELQNPTGPRRLSPERRQDHAKRRDADAQFRLRADAVGTAVPVGRRRAYRAADRSEGTEPRRRRCRGADPGAGGVCVARARRRGWKSIPAPVPRRVWKAQRFSWWMTSILHRFDADTPFENRVRLAELDTLFGSEKASAALAENYVGLPLIL